MTHRELRAWLARIDARQLREDADIRQVTVARALGVTGHQVLYWETGRSLPRCPAGLRWARFTAGLERHARVRSS